MRTLPLLVLPLLLTACGGSHPLAGTWVQKVTPGEPAIELQFDAASDKAIGHFERNGRHVHLSGTYRLDGSNLTVTASWDDTGEGVQWTGSVQGKTLELRSGGAALTFAHSEQGPKGH